MSLRLFGLDSLSTILSTPRYYLDCWRSQAAVVGRIIGELRYFAGLSIEHSDFPIRGAVLSLDEGVKPIGVERIKDKFLCRRVRHLLRSCPQRIEYRYLRSTALGANVEDFFCSVLVYPPVRKGGVEAFARCQHKLVRTCDVAPVNLVFIAPPRSAKCKLRRIWRKIVGYHVDAVRRDLHIVPD